MKKNTFTFKNDEYKKARGGYSRLLDIGCEKCGKHLFFYQKDGPGILKRLYLDRILGTNEYEKFGKEARVKNSFFICHHCGELLGMPYFFKKENRLAFKLFVGEVTKKIVKAHKS